MNKMIHWTIRLGAVAAVFFGLSLSVDLRDRNERQTLPELNVRLASMKPIHAAASNWDAVRGIATFVNDLTKGVDSIILGLQNSGALNQTQTIEISQGLYKLRLNPTFNAPVNNSALGARTYAVSLEVWRASDDVKYLELYFDDPSAKSEVLAIWQPNVFDATVNQSGSNKIECLLSGGAADGFMLCSWNGPIEDPGAVTAARFKVDADSSAGTVSVKGLAEAIANPCPGGSPDYYALAFVTRSASPFYTTAQFGFNDGGVASTTCGLPNAANSAYFNTTANPTATDSNQYFVTDGIGPGEELPEYPSLADTGALFGQIGAGSDADGVSITIADLGALSIAFQGALAPGF